MMKTFLAELIETFPEENEFGTALATFEALSAITPRRPLEMFVSHMSPHSDALMSKDDRLFSSKLDIGFDLAAIWNAPGVTQKTKDAIWSYLQSLFLLGVTVTNLPSHMLENIEKIAHDCASKMQQNPSASIDFASVASSLMQNMHNMQNKLA
jgi:hypothetical protein